MAQRGTREEAWSYFEHVLEDTIVAEVGHVACLDANGEITIAAEGTGLVPIGLFDEDKTGDGTITVRVRLFREIILHWFENDGTNTVVAADIGGPCYLDGANSVGNVASGRSLAGTVWGVSATYGVLVRVTDF